MCPYSQDPISHVSLKAGQMRSLFSLLLVSSIACSSGGPPPPKLYSVTGTLKLDGKPLVDTQVMLMPEDMTSKAQPCSGRSDADGKFKIATNGNRGATVGKYKVVLGSSVVTSTKGPMTIEESMKISAAGVKSKGMPKPKFDFPKEWSNPKTSPKTVEVTERGLVFDIDI